jgi:hypothetical protein
VAENAEANNEANDDPDLRPVETSEFLDPVKYPVLVPTEACIDRDPTEALGVTTSNGRVPVEALGAKE